MKQFIFLLLWTCLSLQETQAMPITYSASLSGAAENPATGSNASGSAHAVFDTTANTLTLSVSFTNLSAPASAAHIHCCASAPTNVAVTVPATGFPAATSGTYSTIFDLTSSSAYTSTFITANGGTVLGAENALAAGLASGMAYFNIHDSIYPGGEIRGYFAVASAATVPEPATLILLAVGLLLVAYGKRHGLH